MMQFLSQAMEEMKQYRETKDTSHWASANQHLLELDRKLCAYQLFRLLKEDPCVLRETESLLNTLAQETLDGFDIAEEEENAQPEAVEYHWAAYVENYKTYRNILTNLASFNQTIRFFIQHYLSTLRKMDSENYAAALYEYLNDPRAAQKIIAGPFSGGLYSNADPVLLNLLSAWHAGVVSDLDAALEELYGEWALYLDGTDLPEIHSLEDLRYFDSLQSLQISYYDWVEPVKIDLSYLAECQHLRALRFRDGFLTIDRLLAMWFYLHLATSGL